MSNSQFYTLTTGSAQKYRYEMEVTGMDWNARPVIKVKIWKLLPEGLELQHTADLDTLETLVSIGREMKDNHA